MPLHLNTHATAFTTVDRLCYGRMNAWVLVQGVQSDWLGPKQQGNGIETNKPCLATDENDLTNPVGTEISVIILGNSLLASSKLIAYLSPLTNSFKFMLLQVISSIIKAWLESPLRKLREGVGVRNYCPESHKSGSWIIKNAVLLATLMTPRVKYKISFQHDSNMWIIPLCFFPMGQQTNGKT